MATPSAGTSVIGTMAACGNNFLCSLRPMLRLVFVCLFSVSFLYAGAQDVPAYDIRYDNSKDVVRRSPWQTLQRPTLRNPVTTFYSFAELRDGTYSLELKISADGMKFVVPQNAALDIDAGELQTIRLYNTRYKASCKGCGARKDNWGMQGVTVSFPMSKRTLADLSENYVCRYRLHLPENMLGGSVTLGRSEAFLEELSYFLAD